MDYDAWGCMDKKAVIKGPDGEVDVVMSYTGHPYDQVLGLYFAQARMYDQGDRRFVAVDPIVGNGPMPQVLIQYVYVINNPVKYIDLDGLEVATVSVNGVSMTVDTSSSNSVLKMLKLFDIDVRKVSTQNIFTDTVDVQVYNYVNKAASVFKFKKNMAITDILNYAGISAGSSGSAYFSMIWCGPNQSYKYAVTAQNKYEHYLGMSISSIENYLNQNATFEDFLLVDSIYFSYQNYYPDILTPEAVLAATYLLKTQGKETAKNKLIALNYDSSVNAFGLDVGIVGHIMAGYEISRLGKTSAQVQAQFDSIKRQEIVMIWAIYGGIIADALLTDAWVPVYYSEKSALDMLEKNGYLTQAQQQMLNWKWNGADPGALSKLPANVYDTFLKYEAAGWQGQLSGAADGTKAGRAWENSKNQLPVSDKHNNPVAYREFDVNDRIAGQGRDAERFVVGTDNSVYYTNDHYQTFTRIK